MAEWYAPAPGETALWTCVFVGGPSAGKKLTFVASAPLTNIRMPLAAPTAYTAASTAPSFETANYRRRPDPLTELNTGVVTYDFVEPAYAGTSNSNIQVTIKTSDPF